MQCGCVRTYLQEGRTVFLCAASGGHEGVIQLLLDSKANHDTQDKVIGPLRLALALLCV